MYSYLYAIIGLSLFQILYPSILIEIFKKKWLHIDNKVGALTKDQIRKKMTKREYTYMLPISIIILIIDIILFAYVEYTYKLNLDINEPLDIPSFIVLLFVTVTIIWLARYLYQQTRMKHFKRRGRTISKPLESIESDEEENEEKEQNEEKIKSIPIEIYSILASLNAIIFAFVFTLTL